MTVKTTYFKNAWRRSQNSGWAMVAPYVESDSVETVGGITLLSSVSRMSFSTKPGTSLEGDGDRTTDGIRWCRDGFDPGVGLSERGGFPPPRDISGVDKDGEGDGEAAKAGLDGSQSNPGLIIKLTVSPSLTLYSFKSFPSARALPFRSRRCASAGGAEGSAAS